MEQDEKIDKIFSIVAKTQLDVAVLSERTNNIVLVIDDHREKIKTIESVVEFFKEKRAEAETAVKIAGKATWFFFGLGGTVLGGVLVILITRYFLK